MTSPLSSFSSSSHLSIRHYRGYFDLTTQDVIAHLINAATPSKRDFFDLLERPDLYGPIWVPSSVAFFCFALGNLTNWIRVRDSFEYNFASLVSAFTFLNLFVFGVPFVLSYCNASTSNSILNVITLFGYSVVYMVPPAIVCVAVGRKFGFGVVLCGAVAGGYSIANKLRAREIQALPGATRPGQERRCVSHASVAYFVVHLIVYLVCFF
jgi:hypothetical protein